MKMRKNIKKEIEKAALQYNLQLVYAFGSKGKEALLMSEGKIASLYTL